MRRLLPLVFLLALLLTACGVESTPTAIVPPTTQPAAAAPTNVVANTDGIALRRSNLPKIDAPALSVGAAADTAASATSAKNIKLALPALAQTALRLKLPALSGAAARQRLETLGAPENWTVLVDDDFSTPDPEVWGAEDLDGGSIAVDQGDLSILAHEGWLINTSPSSAASITDGYVAATFTVDGSGSAGVMARSGSDSNGLKAYVCWANNDGVFACYKRTKGAWAELASGQNSGVTAGEANTLALQAVGSKIAFSINDEAVASFTDTALARGAWGVFAQSDAGDTTVHFSHVEIARAASGPVPPSPTATEAAPEPSATRTARPTLTRSAPPTRTKTAVATRTPLLPRSTATPTAAASSIVADSDFENGDSGTWPVNPEGNGYTLGAEDGAYVMNLQDAGSMLIAFPKEAAKLEDGAIAADVQIDASGSAGVMVRFQKSSNGEWSLYFCYVDNDGAFVCAKEIKDDISIIADGTDSSFKSGGMNHLELSVSGNQLSFTINGGDVISVSDDELTKGAFGLVVDSADSNVTARFDRVVITQP